MPTTIESLELEIQSKSASAEKGIDALSESLEKLKIATQGLGLRGVSNQLSNINAAAKQMDSSSADKISKLASSLEKLKGLGSIKISTSIGNQIRNISSAVSGLSSANLDALRNLSGAIQPLSSLGKASGLQSAITQLNKLPQLAQTLNTINWTTLTTQLQSLSNALAPLANQLNTVSAAFQGLPANIRRVVTATNALPVTNKKAASSYVDFWAKARMAYNAVMTGARVIASWITQSNQYIEDVNLFTASMGQYAAEAQKYAERVGELMGIDPGQFMRYQGTFNTIISGFGVASDKAYLMSKNLTQLGYDLSSFFNISFEDSMQKLQSGISGELEPLRRLGYDLSVARLQQEALNLGITKSVNSMTQAEKSQLRYYAIMTQVTTAQGDMARTLNAPANQLRVLQAQVTQCARALGNIFIPALNAVLPYAIALAKVLRMVAQAIASFFGFELPEVDYSGISVGASAVGDLADNAGSAADGLGDAAKAAKKLKNATLGIDELNIISPNDSSAGGGGGGAGGGGGGLGIGGSDLGIDLPEYDFLGDLVSARVDEIVTMIENALNEITATISIFSLAIGTILVVTGANIPVGLALMAVGAAGLVSVIAANWNYMSERLAKVLTVLMGVLGGFFLAIGAFLAFSGVNVPLGAALMVAGATALVTAVAINWKFLEGDLRNILSILTGIVAGALLAMGALFAFTGVDVPLGIALMAAGAVGLATAVALNWKGLSDPVKKVIGTLMAIVGGALLAFGVILAFSGVNLPLGIALIAAGAVSLISAAVLNWDATKGNVESAIKGIVSVVSGALLGIGAIMALSGVAMPIGIALIAAGAVGLVASAPIDWGYLANKLGAVLKEIGIIVGVAALAVGAILAFTGVALPLGIALMAAGAVSLVAGVALNWNTIVDKIKGVLKEIGIAAGAAMLAIGLILCLSGAGIPLGIALIAAGAGSLVSGVALNWDTITDKVSSGLDTIADKFNDFRESVCDKLEDAGESIREWAGGVKEFFTKGADGKNALDNIREAATEWGDSFKEGLSSKFSDANSWVQTNIVDKMNNAIKNSKAIEFFVEVANDAKTWWSNVKDWFSEKAEEGVDFVTSVTAEMDEWKDVLQDKVIDFKANMSTWKDSLMNKIIGFKANMSTWKDSLQEKIIGFKAKMSSWQDSLREKVIGFKAKMSSWSDSLKDKIISFKAKMSTWQDSLREKIINFKAKMASWQDNLRQKVISFRAKMTTWTDSLKEKTISFKAKLTSWVDALKNKVLNFGASATGRKADGGYYTNGTWNSFAGGGYIDGKGKVGLWDSIPRYANGTANAGNYGSLFIAGEAGAELVGHINGQTEVLNRSQIAQAMKSAVVAGMSQFTGYWRSMYSQMTVCSNAIIRSILVSSDVMYASLATAGGGYDPTNALSQSVYEDSQRGYNNSFSSDSFSRAMREFYQEYVEPTLREIAEDTKRQADKDEQTIVQVGNRTINDAVVTQQRANGYTFVK